MNFKILVADHQVCSEEKANEVVSSRPGLAEKDVSVTPLGKRRFFRCLSRKNNIPLMPLQKRLKLGLDLLASAPQKR